MTKNESVIREFITSTFVPTERAATFSNDEDLLALLDSLQVLRTIIFVEATFDIKVEDDDLDPENLGSIRKLAALVARKRGLASSPGTTERANA